MNKNFTKYRTKAGAASLYVVIFIALLLSVITLSFTRIILSELSQTSNNDLSQSAYDAALAGVEDAKIALLNYQQCVKQNAGNCLDPVTTIGSNPNQCDNDSVVKALDHKRSQAADGSVYIQESSSSTNDNSLAQAYTCVKIIRDLSDYRLTLSSENRLHVVPLHAKDSAALHSVKYVKLSWHSAANGTDSNYMQPANRFSDTSSDITPPVVSAGFITTGNTFTIDNLVNNTLVFVPQAGSTLENNLALSTQRGSGAAPNSPRNLHCHTNDWDNRAFACNAKIDISASPLVNNNASFLVLSLPYGSKDTDFSVQLLTNNGQVINFDNVQASIDSTGRANDLYRRVEARVSLSDTSFPYPEYTLQLANDSSNGLSKNFWVTDNCWHSDDDANKVQRCQNHASL